MRILITSIVDLAKGPPTRLHWFIRHLSKSHEIDVLSINDWWKSSKPDGALYMQGFEIGPTNIVHLTQRRISPILQEILSTVSINGLLESMSYRDFDVHLNYNTLLSGYSVARRLKSAGINTVYDIADDLPKMVGSSPQIPAPFRSLGKLVGRLTLKKNTEISSRVAFVTANLRNLYPVSEGKGQIIPNGVDIELFRPGSAHLLRRELGLEGYFVIGFIGTIREWVDFEPVFAAVKDLGAAENSIRLLIVGDEGGMGRAKKLAGRYGILEKIVFTGTVPIVRVPEYTCCMDVCLMPLRFDNAQPLSFLQYLACCKPVISTRPLEIPPGIVLYASNKEAYKKQILDLLRNQELRTDLGLRGRRYVEQNHNWVELAKDLESVLLSVAKGRPTH